MKVKFFIITFIYLSFFCSAQKYKIELQFNYKQPYCGGIQPSPESVAELEKDKVIDNYKFYVYRKSKCIDSVLTNNDGKIILNYKAGTYNLLEDWKHFKKTPDGSPLNEYDKTCLKKEWSKSNYKLTIITTTNFKLELVDIIIKGKCFYKYPCLIKRHLPQ